MSNSGLADLQGELVTAGGGRVRRSEGRESGYAVRLPAFDEGEPATALVLLRPLGKDVLAPGTADFALGADVMLDVETTGSSDDTTDNGDNVLQRGFALDPAQLQAPGRRRQGLLPRHRHRGHRGGRGRHRARARALVPGVVHPPR